MKTALALLLLVALALPVRAEPEHQYRPVAGPKRIKVGDSLATIDVPKGYLYLDKGDTDAFLKANGNVPSEQDLATVVGADEASRWFVVLEWEPLGYINDDDADQLDADALLKQVKEGNEAANDQRKEQGFDALDIVGWFEKPRYDRGKHSIVWAVEGRDKNGRIVNYKTRLLGRKGVLSLNLVTDPATLAGDRQHSEKLLAATGYVAGERYADYKPGTDRDSGLNLTGLILGGGSAAAAAKTGLLAKVGKLLIGALVAGKKLVVLVLAGIGGLIAFLYRRKSEEPPAA